MPYDKAEVEGKASEMMWPPAKVFGEGGNCRLPGYSTDLGLIVYDCLFFNGHSVSFCCEENIQHALDLGLINRTPQQQYYANTSFYFFYHESEHCGDLIEDYIKHFLHLKSSGQL